MDKSKHKQTDPEQLACEYLDPKLVRLHRGPAGAARLCVEGHDKSYIKLSIACAFPLTEPDTNIGFLDGKGSDIGTLRDIRELDPESLKIAQEELAKRYFMPRILKIIELKHEYDISYFQVETDRGKRDFTMRGHRENCQEITPGRFVIEDIDGNRFELEDYTQLDKHGQELLNQVI